MRLNVTNKANGKWIPIQAVALKDISKFMKTLSPFEKKWVGAHVFKSQGDTVVLPSEKGDLGRVLWVYDDDLWAGAKLAQHLKPLQYRIDGLTPDQLRQVAIAWALGAYSFDAYKNNDTKHPTLVAPGLDHEDLRAWVDSIWMVRDMINTPANDMSPSHMEDLAKSVAKHFKASFSVVRGDDLIQKNFPLIHAVGRAGETPPRLLEFTWGNPKHPKIALVGKGVTFDTGGLNLKTGSGMRHMKKDMGGAAVVLGLAQLIMAQKLNVRLHVLLPCVENNVAANAMRPGDIYKTRCGKTVEIGNTDAEGRLILADAIAYAAEDKPEVIIDCATLTGAARVALGTEIPAFFTNKDKLAALLEKASVREQDPLWRLPLWAPYKKMLKGKLADLENDAGGTGFGGAITAALFLEECLPADQPWIHVDMMAWNQTSAPGRPQGGEAQGIRALFSLIQKMQG